MDFHQFYLGCLAHASYLVGSDGEAAIVDPQRDVEQYIAEAEKRGLRIRYVIETHLHADFVSGHRELAERTGAEIVLGANAEAQFPHMPVRQGDVLRLGSVELRAIETPGHTPESISWLVVENGRAVKVLTGDTLFIGDVGRPDLAGAKGYTPRTMAGMLYDSLHNKLMKLGDDIEVWPAHGAGSACGRNISTETWSTIGVQRRTNYALGPMSRDDFITIMTTDLPDVPPYFMRDAEINRIGARALSEITAKPLTTRDVKSALHRGAIALDVRDSDAFGAGHIGGAINIGLAGQYASWCGTLLNATDDVVVVADGAEASREAVIRLARVGMENVIGYLDGGVLAWSNAGYATAQLPQITARALSESRLPVIDVRRKAEYATGHVPGARNIPLNELAQREDEIRTDEPLAVICAGGYRSSIAASILARSGVADLTNVAGGTSAWIAEKLPLEV
ncbi:MAG TPA: rhodanese-like domain-containing protein [Thermoanaerobaculia bacterium]